MKICFKTTYRTSIYDYLKNYRMQKAAALLINTELSITDVAITVGYYNASKFASAFKAFIGLTPSDYRKKFVFHQLYERDGALMECFIKQNHP